MRRHLILASLLFVFAVTAPGLAANSTTNDSIPLDTLLRQDYADQLHQQGRKLLDQAERTDQFLAARETLARVVEYHYNSAPAHYDYGRALEATGAFEKAREEYALAHDIALEIAPDAGLRKKSAGKIEEMDETIAAMDRRWILTRLSGHWRGPCSAKLYCTYWFHNVGTVWYAQVYTAYDIASHRHILRQNVPVEIDGDMVKFSVMRTIYDRDRPPMQERFHYRLKLVSAERMRTSFISEIPGTAPVLYDFEEMAGMPFSKRRPDERPQIKWRGWGQAIPKQQPWDTAWPW